MGVMIPQGMFGKDDGQIQWYGIIATINMSLPQPSGETINHTWRDHYYRGHDSYLAVLLPTPSTRSPAEILDSACGYRGLWPHQRDVQWAAQARFPV